MNFAKRYQLSLLLFTFLAFIYFPSTFFFAPSRHLPKFISSLFFYHPIYLFSIFFFSLSAPYVSCLCLSLVSTPIISIITNSRPPWTRQITTAATEEGSLCSPLSVSFPVTSPTDLGLESKLGSRALIILYRFREIRPVTIPKNWFYFMCNLV